MGLSPATKEDLSKGPEANPLTIETPVETLNNNSDPIPDETKGQILSARSPDTKEPNILEQIKLSKNEKTKLEQTSLSPLLGNEKAPKPGTMLSASNNLGDQKTAVLLDDIKLEKPQTLEDEFFKDMFAIMNNIGI